MIVCTKCGRQNPDGARFCEGCGNYLEWSGERVDESPRTAAVARLLQAAPSVDPGQAIVVVLEVRNTGSIVDAFDVHVLGPAATWISPEPAQLRLFPDAGGTVNLRIAPPRGPQVRAGPAPFTVRVTSVTDPRVGAEERGEVAVGAVREVTARLVPLHSEGVTSATHRFEVTNQGNVPVDARVAAVDPDERLTFDVQPPGLFRLEPGHAGTITVVVRPRRPLEQPVPRSWPFQVRLDTPDAPSVAVDGSMLQQPPAPPVQQPAPAPAPARQRGCGCWVPALLVAAAAAVVLVLGLQTGAIQSLFAGIVSPTPTQQPTTNPTETPTPTPTPVRQVTVPEVTGLTAADALNRLQAAGLRGRQTAAPSTTVPSGRVIRTEPGGGTRQAVGSEVLVVVSAGRTPG